MQRVCSKFRKCNKLFLLQTRSLQDMTRPKIRTGSQTDMTQPKIKTISVTGMGTGSKMVSKLQDHTLIMDEPGVGGNKGPTPLSTALGALIGCENATAKWLSRKELKIEIESIEFRIEGEYDTRGFLGVEGVPPRFQRVKGVALVKTTGTQEQVDELAQLTAKRCPVASLFTDAGVKLEIEWKKA